MNSMERLAALGRGEQPDCVPLFCNLLDQGAHELGLSPQEYYRCGQLVAEGQSRLWDKYGHDVLWGSFHVAFEAELLGCDQLSFPHSGPPTVARFILDSEESLERFRAPSELEGHPRLAEQRRLLAALRDVSRGECPVAAMVVGSLSLPPLLCGMERWLELLLCGPAALRDQLVAECRKFTRARIEGLRQMGAQLIAYVSSCATCTFLDMERWRSLALPTIVADLAGLGAADLVYFNGGGRIGPTIPELLEHTALRTFYLNPMDDIAAAKRAVCGQALIVGAVNDVAFVLASPEEVEDEVARVLRAGMEGGGFGLGTLVMPASIPGRNIRALVDAARRLGAYHA